MAKSLFTAGYDRLRRSLIATRNNAGLTQARLAARLGRPQSFVSKYERGERRLDVIEFLEVAEALHRDPEEMLKQLKQHGDAEAAPGEAGSILDRWDLSAAELTAIVDDNPSLRGIMLGYVAETKLSRLLEASADVSESLKYDDHDRTKKGDRVIVYKKNRFVVESKSLQTNSVRFDGARWTGKVQVDASDKRQVTLRDGTVLQTTCLLVGGFDILAVNLFAFGNQWRFVFAKNADLPRSRFKGYTPRQKEQLLATLVPVTWPPEPPFYSDVFAVLEELIRSRARE